MSYNGSGTFLINSAGQPVVANTVISATVFNALTSDLATGLSTAITKDGQTTVTANIPFGNNKITTLGAGTAATDAANLGQVQSTAAKLITVTGTDTITGSMSPQLTAYAAGQLLYFIANAANTGAVTINVDGLGAKAITRDGSTALAAGDINSGEVVVIVYDGTRFQMINAANSFGNTTINGTLTVTGNTGLQANVSITSALSVGGTFNVTGAATLGSTLAVTGKSDLPTVSTASINAAVAVVTTGTVTNLTATSASVASVNAGVALLTTATVTDLTASSASIASANIGNLQFTAASIASINAGVAVVTNLTATSASIASANVGTAVVTTGTVTNLTSTSASIASANAAVALVTTGTVTNLTSTSASIASANLGNAVATTLTATGASVASANVGTAVVTGLTVTNASIASLNAGTATITTGNLTFSSTAQRITGDMSGAFANRLAFQTSTTNGNTILGILANGTPADFAGTGLACNAVSDTTNTQTMSMFVFKNLEASLRSGAAGTGTYLPMTFFTGGAERMRLDTSGNLGIGTASPVTTFGKNLTLYNDANTGTVASNTYLLVQSLNRNGVIDIASSATGTGSLNFVTTPGTTLAGIAGDIANSALAFRTGGTTERMRIDSSGNVGIGTASPGVKLDVVGDIRSTTGNFYAVNGGAFGWGDLSTYVGGNASTDFINFVTAGSERARIDSSGNVGIGGTASAFVKLQLSGTYPTGSNVTRAVFLDGTIPSGTTGTATGFHTSLNTQAASFTNANLVHFYATQGTFGAGSTVTTQYGYFAESSLTGATNNYGFYSNIASGSNRWNFYAAGTAANYFAGNVGIGTTSIGVPLDVGAGSGSVSIRINGASSGNGNGANIYFSNASAVVGTLGNPSVVSGGAFDNSIALTGYYGLRFDTTGTERMRITAAGNISAGAGALATTATDGFLYVPTCAGTPTGTPTAITGMAPIVVDTTNNKLYFYSTGVWRDAGP